MIKPSDQTQDAYLRIAGDPILPRWVGGGGGVLTRAREGGDEILPSPHVFRRYKKLIA